MTLSGIGELFYHWNVKTPYWLGFVVQRPESHLIHHEEGLHDYNYSDLPIWDILFGTFRNPHEWNERCGFGSGQEQMVIEMLHGIDASKSAPKTLGKRPARAACLTAATGGLRIGRRFHQEKAEPKTAGACGGGAAALGEHRRETLGADQLAGRLELRGQPLEPLFERLEFFRLPALELGAIGLELAALESLARELPWTPEALEHIAHALGDGGVGDP
jgi:hypothetical protein